MSNYELKISLGNIKLGNIQSLSMPPVKTCAPNVPCAAKCYANKGYLKNARATWQKNLDYYKGDSIGFFQKIDQYLWSNISIKVFRIHVGGDFVDMAYLRQWIAIARVHDGIKFLAFTKRYAMLKELLRHKTTRLPENLTLVASAWPGLPMPRKVRKNFQVAWMQDGSETRMPKDVIECAGSCEACGMCWDLPQIGKDVCIGFH